VAAHCTAPPSTGTNVRGSANVPGGDPISTSGGGVAYPRVRTTATSDPIQIGTGLDGAGLVGDRSWLAILTTALS
jgi:phospholipid/cholesterol/gamma-HCH transport system substrate-binding protein